MRVSFSTKTTICEYSTLFDTWKEYRIVLSGTLFRSVVATLCRAIACLPALALAVLYVQAARLTYFTGHLPELYRDFKTGGGFYDTVFHWECQILGERFFGLVPFTLYSVLALPLLMGLAAVIDAPLRKRVWALVYVLGMTALFFEPGQRLAWSFD